MILVFKNDAGAACACQSKPLKATGFQSVGRQGVPYRLQSKVTMPPARFVSVRTMPYLEERLEQAG